MTKGVKKHSLTQAHILCCCISPLYKWVDRTRHFMIIHHFMMPHQSKFKVKCGLTAPHDPWCHCMCTPWWPATGACTIQWRLCHSTYSIQSKNKILINSLSHKDSKLIWQKESIYVEKKCKCTQQNFWMGYLQFIT